MHYRRLLKHGDPLCGGTLHGDPMRFIHEVALRHTSEDCLLWPYARSVGYGQLRVDGKHIRAHRYICELVHGAPPTPEHEAAHSCGNGDDGCIAPGHLDWKTHAENEADKLVHGTHSRGERHGHATLTEPEARQILALKGIVSQRKLGDRFGVSHQTIGKIHAGENWSWLE